MLRFLRVLCVLRVVGVQGSWSFVFSAAGLWFNGSGFSATGVLRVAVSFLVSVGLGSPAFGNPSPQS